MTFWVIVAARLTGEFAFLPPFTVTVGKWKQNVRCKVARDYRQLNVSHLQTWFLRPGTTKPSTIASEMRLVETSINQIAFTVHKNACISSRLQRWKFASVIMLRCNDALAAILRLWWHSPITGPTDTTTVNYILIFIHQKTTFRRNSAENLNLCLRRCCNRHAHLNVHRHHGNLFINNNYLLITIIIRNLIIFIFNMIFMHEAPQSLHRVRGVHNAISCSYFMCHPFVMAWLMQKPYRICCRTKLPWQKQKRKNTPSSTLRSLRVRLRCFGIRLNASTRSIHPFIILERFTEACALLDGCT